MMKTTSEKIAVMQAYDRGETIEWSPIDKNEWIAARKDNIPLAWNWDNYDYRIKSEPRYRPFKNAEEVMGAIREHGIFMYYEMYQYYTTPARIHDVCIQTNASSERWDYSDALIKFTFADGTPFGVKED